MIDIQFSVHLHVDMTCFSGVCTVCSNNNTPVALAALAVTTYVLLNRLSIFKALGLLCETAP